LKRIVIFVLMILLGGNLFAQGGLIKVHYRTFDKEILIDQSFKRYTAVMNDLALLFSIKVEVQESFRIDGEVVDNAIVVPAKKSNHLVGHALDINLEYKNKLYNSPLLNNYESLPKAIKNFITGCKIAGMQWGGDFPIKDGVHFDDRLYEKNSKLYEELYKKYQKK